MWSSLPHFAHAFFADASLDSNSFTLSSLSFAVFCAAVNAASVVSSFALSAVSSGDINIFEEHEHELKELFFKIAMSEVTSGLEFSSNKSSTCFDTEPFSDTNTKW